MFELRDCTASWEGRPALRGVSVAARAGAVTCVLGPSGSGKSTLLLVAAGLKRPDAGSTTLDGVAVSPGDQRTALVLQDYGLMPWLTALDNAALGLRVRGTRRGPARDAARAMLARFGLAGREGASPSALSGGERQRVALARALCLSPAVLLLDEPFSALDAMSREALQELLRATVEREALAALLVTHSVEEAAFLGRTIVVLSGAPGSVASVIENPSQGGAAFRTDPAWFATCTRLRASLESAGTAVRA
jgi:NitT/TauT family transport system ATP-binding protein